MYVCDGTEEACCSKGFKHMGKNWWQPKSGKRLKNTKACSPLPKESELVTFNTLMICILRFVQCSVVNNRTIFVVKRRNCPWHSPRSMSTLDLVAIAPSPLQSVSGCGACTLLEGWSWFFCSQRRPVNPRSQPENDSCRVASSL